MKLNKQILVLEDDPDISEVIDNILTDEGYRVVRSESGKKAQELLDKLEISLITLDLGLSDMTGNDFLHYLANQKLSIPVVVVSANTSLLKPYPHVKSVISKPFDLENLLEAIEEHL